MEINEFRKNAHDLVDWMADYLENIEQYPVKSQVKPGQVMEQLPVHAPLDGESFQNIFDDFKQVIIPGITHWQHPSFMAYFNGNSSPPSVLGEMLMATLSPQCMMWQTSPAAAELEERVMDWLKEMLGLPAYFKGVIQDTASSATLISILTARERASNFEINRCGYDSIKKYAVYCSSETHSSIEKGVKIAGFGSDNIRKIPVDENFAMKAGELEKAIKRDLEDNIIPVCVIATIGTTGSTAIDPVKQIGRICKKYNIWLHVDAAFSGTALMLEEKRWMGEGLEYADTFVFNPHKWMFTNLDCSAYYVKDEEALIRTFEILPEYLKTKEESRVNNYRDWGIALGRRFRALKLWFVIRSYGVNGIKEKLRYHIQLADELAEKIEESNDFEMLAPHPVTLLCFRYKPENIDDDERLNEINSEIIEQVNNSGKLYMTHTKLDGKYSLRLVIGQTYITRKNVTDAWELIEKTAKELRMR